MREAIHVYAVVRVDDFNAEFGDSTISIKEILPTLEEAIREVERLNKLNADKECHYFWQLTRYFPQGRSMKPDESIADPD
jgi:hypothetical protein